MSDLSGAQLGAVEEAVRAVVMRDEERLATMHRGPDDLYVWTRDYGQYGSVELVMPPGAASRWLIEATEIVGAKRIHVVVPMWTRQEGAST